jgi:hypothetical protein
MLPPHALSGRRARRSPGQYLPLLVVLALGTTAASALAVGPVATSGPPDRWTLSTIAGVSTLALVRPAGGAPLIMFVCRARTPGIAQVIVPNPADDLQSRRLRIDLAVGNASATIAAEHAVGVMDMQTAVIGEITVPQVNQLLRANALALHWRVEVTNSATRPQNTALLPHPLNRIRGEFLRHCA